MSLESLKYTLEIVGILAVGVSFACGAAALVIGNRINKHQAAQLSQFDKDLTDGKTKLANQQIRAASLEIEAATLSKQISAQERRANVLLNPEHRRQVISDARSFAGQDFDVVSCGIKESEIVYFPMAVWSTLEAAGWKVGKIETNSPSCSAGLAVMVNPDTSKPTREAAQVILDSFIRYGLMPSGSRLAPLPNPPDTKETEGTWHLKSSGINSVLILVGTHP